MENIFSPNFSRNTLKIGALFNLVWGLLCIFVPQAFLTTTSSYPYVVFLGLIYCSLAFALILSSLDIARHWLVILLSFVVSFFASAIYLYLTLKGSFTPGNGLPLFAYHFLMLVPYIGVLNKAYIENTEEESAPKKFHDLVKVVRTSHNKTLLELSNDQNVLLVFVRHFGCTFCRETVSEIAKIDEAIIGKKLTLVYVHMSDIGHGDEFFNQYYNHPVHHISDPAKKLYQSLNLKRGSLMQIFGPMTWIRGIYAGLIKGHGLGQPEGDSLQLGGVFVLSKGQIIFEQKFPTASYLFQINTLPEL